MHGELANNNTIIICLTLMYLFILMRAVQYDAKKLKSTTTQCIYSPKNSLYWLVCTNSRMLN